MIYLYGFVIFLERLDIFIQTVSSCKLQNPMVLISELVKALNLYSNPGVAHHSNMNNNSNARVVSKRFWLQKAQSN